MTMRAERMMNPVVNCALYEGGRRLRDLDIADPAQMKVEPGQVVWIGLYEPDQAVLRKLQSYFGLHELAIEDAYKAHQRPKLEVYGDTLFIVMKTAQLVEGHVALGETAIFVGRGYVITIRHGPSLSYAAVRARCENLPANLRKGEDFILYALMDFIIDQYFPIIDHLEDKIDEIENKVFVDADLRQTLEEIVDLRRDLLEMRHAVAPVPDICQRLMRFDMAMVDGDVRPYFRDVSDHAQILLERIETLREALQAVVESKMLLTSIRQSDVTRQLAAWAAILAVPTAITGIYGMNFAAMPELGWRFGYPLVLAAIFFICIFLYWRFKRSGWL
jgi:magnesium transporter